MLTDFFETTKKTIKREKPESSKTSTAAKDILESKQYDFNRSAIPQNDDIEILEVIPSCNKPDKKAEPFVLCIPEMHEDEIKQEIYPTDMTPMKESSEVQFNMWMVKLKLH